MEVKGTIIEVLPVVNGGNGSKTWAKQEFILQTQGQYPKKICMNLWGEEKITKYDIEVGIEVTAHIEIESREYNGRWYTDVRAWQITWDKQQKRGLQSGGTQGRTTAPYNSPTENEFIPNVGDDSPF